MKTPILVVDKTIDDLLYKHIYNAQVNANSQQNSYSPSHLSTTKGPRLKSLNYTLSPHKLEAETETDNIISKNIILKS